MKQSRFFGILSRGSVHNSSNTLHTCRACAHEVGTTDALGGFRFRTHLNLFVVVIDVSVFCGKNAVPWKNYTNFNFLKNSYRSRLLFIVVVACVYVYVCETGHNTVCSCGCRAGHHNNNDSLFILLTARVKLIFVILLV